MSGPVYGGDESLNEGTESRYKGVYANHPAFTPKFNASASLESAQSTQARLYVPVPNEAAYDRILEALPAKAKPYARALVQRGPQFAGRIYVDFVLQGVQEPLQEKVQVTEVLSDAHIAYFFGQRAPTWSFSGIVLNTQQDQWYDAWHILYNAVLRGTKTATFKVPVVVAYDTRRVVGSIIATTTSLSATNETFAQMSFSMLVKRAEFLPEAGARPSNFSVPATQVFSTEDVQQKIVTAQTDTVADQRKQLTESQIKDTVALATFSPAFFLTGGGDLGEAALEGAARDSAQLVTPTGALLSSNITNDYADVRSGADPLVLQTRFNDTSVGPLVTNNTQTQDVQQTPNRSLPGGTAISGEGI